LATLLLASSGQDERKLIQNETVAGLHSAA
jgi:hypothetical protein